MRHRYVGWVFAGSLGAAWAAIACASSSSAPPSSGVGAELDGASGAAGSGVTVDASACTDSAPPPAPLCSEGQSAAIVSALNQAEISEGELAEGQSSTRAVQDFAQTMVNDHSLAEAQFRATWAAASLAVTDGDIRSGIAAASDLEVAALKIVTGAQFDQTYVAHQIVYDAQILGLIDNVLTWSVTSSPFTSELRSLRAVVATHLSAAFALETQIRGACGTPAPVPSGGADDAGGATDSGGGNTQQGQM